MTEQIIAAARAHWQLDTARISLVAARENAVYRVETEAARYALRLHRVGYRTRAQIHSELLWMAWLAAGGIAVPKPVHAADGTDFLEQDGVIVDLLSWIDGDPMAQAEPSVAGYTALGQLMARMHDRADAWVPPSGFDRPTWDLAGDNPTWGRFWENPELTMRQQDQFVDFRETARTALAGIDDADFGLIHADLVPDNVLWAHGVLVPIDFDDGGFGPRLFDVATVTLRSRRIDPDGGLARATQEGYASMRDLDSAALPLFEALRACSYVGWNIARMQEPGGRDRNARFIATAEQAIQSVPNA